MGGGMGGMGGGGMGGGMMSVPPTDLPNALLRPNQTRDLVTRAVSLSPPTQDGRALMPAKGEPLSVGDVTQLDDANPRLELALRRLAADKAPGSISQLVLWHVRYGLDWATLAHASRPWANAYELALARQFVRRIDGPRSEMPPLAAATLYVDVVGEGPRAEAVKKVLEGSYTLGLSVELGVPQRPEGPALACRVQLDGPDAEQATVLVSASDEAGSGWTPMGKFTLPTPADATAESIADAMAQGLGSRLVRARLTEGKKVKGKATYKVRIDNASPLLLNAVSIAGVGEAGDGEQPKPSTLAGFSLPPRRSMSFTATAEMVQRLGLGGGVEVVAADLSGL